VPKGLKVAGRSSLVVVVVLAGFAGIHASGPAGGRLLAADTGPVSFDATNVAELRAALQALSGSTAGGMIRLAPGNYELDADATGVVQPLRLAGASAVNIVGSGWNTVLHRSDAGNLFELENVNFTVIRDLMVAGPGASASSGSGLVFRNSSAITVENCRIQRFAESAVRFEGSPMHSVSGNRLQNCQLVGNRGSQIYGYYNNDFFIQGNKIGAPAASDGTYIETAVNGTLLDNCSAGTYTMNYHWGNDVAFRLAPGSRYNRIENNRFEESGTWGIVIGDPAVDPGPTYHNTFIGNTIHTNSRSASGTYSAVIAYDSQFVVFTGNQMFSWDAARYKHRAGLELARRCWHWTVRDNVFRHDVVGPVILGTNIGDIVGRDPNQVGHEWDASNVVQP